jgi:tetratricopeptide (TPR) repeat protein
MEMHGATWLKKLRQPRILVAILVGLALVGGSVSYYLLRHPESAFMRLFRADTPQRFGMITIGPYPQTDEDYQRLKEGGVKYLVTLLDPRLPYEKPMLEREFEMAARFGLEVKSFPMFPMDSMLDTEIMAGTAASRSRAVEFLQKVDGPAYVHCYLGIHRALSVRDEVIKAGIPEDYLSTTWADWEQVNRFIQAREEFKNGNYQQVIELLEPVSAKTVDIAHLRGQAYYRLSLYSAAAESFRKGLELDSTHPRNRLGLGYCYLRMGQPVLAQRQFNAVLEKLPDEPGALIGQGLAFIRMHNRKAAADSFRAALDQDPDNEEVKGYLELVESM